MTIETATYLSQLDATYPASGDAKSEGDNHIRLLKSTIKATWPNLTATPITDKIKSKFTISPFYTMIHFTFRNICLTHHNFEMIDQRFHVVVHFFFRWKIE